MIRYLRRPWTGPCLVRRFSYDHLLKTTQAQETPKIAISPNQSSTQQVLEIIKLPLWQVNQNLVNRTFKSSFVNLNALSPRGADTMIKTFTRDLVSEITYCLKVLESSNNSSRKQIKDISIVDFINPKLKNIVQLIYQIELKLIPQTVIDYYNYKTKLDLIFQLLTKLIHKHYLEHALLIQLEELSNTDTPATIDLSNPAEWFPEARKMKRKLIMHVGPTNSGKTHNSLQKFAKAKSGYYAGPLRLLAREIYERFQNQGIKCNLITGEEVIPSIDEFGKVSDLSSGTIEMIPNNKRMEICIIDEIQMIADPNRGSAWTNAVLGVQAKEVHMCGEESAVPLIKRLASITGDELEIKHYKRLGKLTVLDEPIGNFNNLKSGDCVVVFSKRKILELKCSIEKQTKFKVGVIYGALPPEIRSKEAASFNNEEYDILVASDAIGMGLNLKIKRIVFWQTHKFNGNEMEPLSVSATKQIAGRAGRYSEKFGELEGFVTAFHQRDLNFIQKTMLRTPSHIKKAIIWPTQQIWLYYISKFPKGTSFFDILKQFEQETFQKQNSYYELSELDEKFQILQLFLTDNLYQKTLIYDQLALSIAPINALIASDQFITTAFEYFRTISNCESKSVLDFNFLHTKLLQKSPGLVSNDDNFVKILNALEENHKLVLLFLWLSQRWPNLFVDKESASDIKTLIEKRISEELVNMRKILNAQRKTKSYP